MINTHPTRCNICGGAVTYGSNSRIYGREYGSGYCYLCEQCGAYVGSSAGPMLGRISPAHGKPWDCLPTNRCGPRSRCATLSSIRFGRGSRKQERSGATFTAGWLTKWGYPWRAVTSAILTLTSSGGRTSSCGAYRASRCGMTTAGESILRIPPTNQNRTILTHFDSKDENFWW